VTKVANQTATSEIPRIFLGSHHTFRQHLSSDFSSSVDFVTRLQLWLSTPQSSISPHINNIVNNRFFTIYTFAKFLECTDDWPNINLNIVYISLRGLRCRYYVEYYIQISTTNLHAKSISGVEKNSFSHIFFSKQT